MLIPNTQTSNSSSSSSNRSGNPEFPEWIPTEFVTSEVTYSSFDILKALQGCVFRKLGGRQLPRVLMSCIMSWLLPEGSMSPPVDLYLRTGVAKLTGNKPINLLVRGVWCDLHSRISFF